MSTDAQDIYIDLFDAFTVSSEYLQANSEKRYFLPESIIVGGLALAVGAFAKGFLAELGKTVSKAAVGKVVSKFKSSEESGDRDALLEGIALLQPFLLHLSNFSDDQIDVCRKVVAESLSGRGYPVDSANQAANDLINVLLAAGKK